MRTFSTYKLYPYGMLMPGRHAESPSGDYRYGFQGQEVDNEVKGDGNSVNYTYRMHDPRVGRFFAVDPLTAKYPHYTPYSFSGNKVIAWVELEGLEEAAIIRYYDADDVFVGTIVVPVPSELRIDGGSRKVLIVNRTTTESDIFNVAIPHPSSLFTTTTDPDGVATKGLAGGRIVPRSVNKIEQERLDACMDGERYFIQQGTVPVIIPIDVADALITPVSETQVNNFKTALDENPQYGLEITGHASNNDHVSEEYNVNLSQQRVEATINDLSSKGIERTRLYDGGGKGSSQPVSGNDNSTEANRAKNRRTEGRLVAKREPRYD